MLEIVNVNITDIKPFPKNAKLHPKEQIAQIRRSIETYGMNDPIAIDEDNVVIEGHGRLLALQDMEVAEVPCIRLTHLSEEQKRAYILAHNKLTMNIGFDTDLLMGELDFLKESGYDTERCAPPNSESPNAAAECSLSAILTANAPQKYYLSRLAKDGILRRVTARGKVLPEPLRLALEA